jgi:hypothetical protein
MSDQEQPAVISYSARAPQRTVGVGNEVTKKTSTLVFGAPKSGKSTWACMWPAPIFLNIVAEGGNAALDTYPQVAAHLISRCKDLSIPPVFNQEAPPRFDIYFSGHSNDSANISKYEPHHCLQDALDMIEKNWRAWGVATVVLDSIGFLERLWYTDLQAYRLALVQDKVAVPADLKKLLKSSGGGDGKSPGERWAEQMRDQGGVLFQKQDYGLLKNFHQALMEKMNSFPVNRIIIGHEKQILKEDGRGNLLLDKVKLALDGQSVWATPAAADLVIQATPVYQTSTDASSADKRMETSRVFYTMPDKYSVGSVGHRFAFAFPEGKLTDPELGTTPTFRAVYNRIYEHIALPIPSLNG